MEKKKVNEGPAHKSVVTIVPVWKVGAMPCPLVWRKQGSSGHNHGLWLARTQGPSTQVPIVGPWCSTFATSFWFSLVCALREPLSHGLDGTTLKHPSRKSNMFIFFENLTCQVLFFARLCTGCVQCKVVCLEVHRKQNSSTKLVFEHEDM